MALFGLLPDPYDQQDPSGGLLGGNSFRSSGIPLGLINAGAGLLAGGDPRMPQSFGTAIGRGLYGFGQGMQEGAQSARRNALADQSIKSGNVDLYSKLQAINRYNRYIGAPQITMQNLQDGSYNGTAGGASSGTGASAPQPAGAGMAPSGGAPAAGAEGYDSIMADAQNAALAGMPKEFVDARIKQAEGSPEYLIRKALSEKGLVKGADGVWRNADGSTASQASLAGAIAGATAAAAFPYDIAKQNNQGQVTIGVNRASPMVFPPGGAIGVYGGGGVGSNVPRVGGAGAPPAPAPAPAPMPSGQRPGLPASTSAAPPVTAPVVAPTGFYPPAAGNGPPNPITRMPDGTVVNTNTPQSINLGTDRASSYRTGQGTKLSDQMDTVLQGGAAGQDSVRQLGELSAQLRRIPTNLGAEDIANGAKLALNFGWDINKILPPGMQTDPVAVDAANKNISELAMVIARANFPGGRITNSDLQTAVRATPNLSNLPGANQILLDNLANTMRLKIEQAKFYRQYERAAPGAYATADFEGKTAGAGELDNGVYDAWAAHVTGLKNVPDNVKNSFLSYSDFGGGNSPAPSAALGLPAGAINGPYVKDGHSLYLFKKQGGGYEYREK